MAKSHPFGTVLAALRKEEGTLRSQLGKIQDAIAALGDVPADYKVRQGVRRAKTVAKNARSLTEAQRQAIRTRMKRYWAAKRAAKK